MTIVERLFGRRRPAISAEMPDACRHAEQTPMWDSVEDMGRSDRISRYKCLGCGAFLDVATHNAGAGSDSVSATV